MPTVTDPATSIPRTTWRPPGDQGMVPHPVPGTAPPVTPPAALPYTWQTTVSLPLAPGIVASGLTGTPIPVAVHTLDGSGTDQTGWLSALQIGDQITMTDTSGTPWLVWKIAALPAQTHLPTWVLNVTPVSGTAPPTNTPVLLSKVTALAALGM